MRITSNAPIIFGKLAHQKDYVVDGAIIDPVERLDNGQTLIASIGMKDNRIKIFLVLATY